MLPFGHGSFVLVDGAGEWSAHFGVSSQEEIHPIELSSVFIAVVGVSTFTIVFDFGGWPVAFTVSSVARPVGFVRGDVTVTTHGFGGKQSTSSVSIAKE